MKNKVSVLTLLGNLPQNNDLEKVAGKIAELKKAAVNEDDQLRAKECWIAQTIVELHSLYRQAFRLIQNKEYYEGWCQLERIEIGLNSLKKHYKYNTDAYSLYQIEKALRNLQIIYPYKLFGSVEILKKSKKCSVCDREISIRKPCGHNVGEIYNGEMCHRIVTAAEVLGMAIVEDPGNKFSVMFLKDEQTGEQKDHYNYFTLEYLFQYIKDPYIEWDLELSERIIVASDFSCGRNDICKCGSGIKFKKCCLKTIGNTYPHYEFIFPGNILASNIQS